MFPPSLPPWPEASRTPERVGFLVYWFMMAPGPSKSWEAREPAIPINQKTRKPTQFRECSPPPVARSLEESRKGCFFGLLVYDGSRTTKALGGQVAGHTNKPENQSNVQNAPPIPPPSPGPNPRTPESFFLFIGL